MLISNIKVPGLYNSKFDLNQVTDSENLSDFIVKKIIRTHVLWDNRNPQKGYLDIADFDTSYLEKASKKGSEENEFFTKYISPILKSINKEEDPGKLLDFYKKEQDLVSNGERTAYSYYGPTVGKVAEPYLFQSGGSTRWAKEKDVLEPSNKYVEKTKDYLEDNGSFLNNFGGEIQSHPKEEVKSIVRKIAEEALRLKESGNVEESKKLRLLIDTIYKSHESKIGSGNSKVKIPVLYVANGLRDPETDKKLSPIQTAFIVEVPKRESFIEDPDSTSQFHYVSEDPDKEKKFKTGYLNKKDIKKYSVFNKDFNEINSLFLDFVETQKKGNTKLNDFFMSVKTDERGKTDISVTDLEKFINFLSRGMNNGRRVKSLYSLSDLYEEPSVKELLKNLTEKEKIKQNEDLDYEGNIEVRGNLKDLDFKIPYSDLKYYAISKGEGGENSTYIYDKYIQAYNRNKNNPETLEKINPIKDRGSRQNAVNNTLSKEEIEDSRYLGYYIASALLNKDVKRIRKYISSTENGDLKLSNNIVEHVTPLREMFDFLWIMFLEMIESGKYSEDQIKKTIRNYVRDLYKEAVIDQDIDRERLTAAGLRDSSGSMLKRYKKNIDSGNIDNDNSWSRYLLGGMGKDKLPVSLSKVLDKTGDRLQDVTYQNIALRKDNVKPQQFQETKKPTLTNILFGYYG